MKPHQFVGYLLNQTSAVTAITSTRIYHGLRPAGTAVPSINYYEVTAAVQYGIERATYSVNCRAATPGAARDLAREVVTAFHGTSGTGIYGTLNSFDVARASLVQDQGLIPEPDEAVYNAPVDLLIVYQSSTVS